jgi:teichuronic acid biosynthesis glycosyltransferase TuaC
MKVLVVTHMYPSQQHPYWGVFVKEQVVSLQREGVDVDVLHIDTKRTKWLYPWGFVLLLKQVLTHHYDLVHAHYVFAGVTARSQFRYPVVLTHHGAETWASWHAPLCRWMSLLVDRTIVVSEQTKAAIGMDSAVVIPCGVDFELFQPRDQRWSRDKLGLPEDKKLVLFVGRYMEREKRFDIAQDAVDRLKAGGVDVELIVVCKEPYERVPLFMNACDVLLLPSEHEGSPQVVKEAMACNLPVVSVDVGDVPEILAGVEGCYVCHRDPVSIAEKVKLILEQPSRMNGREKTQRYELSSIAKRIIQVYEETLAKMKGT